MSTPRTTPLPVLRVTAALAGLLALLCAQVVVSTPASAHARLEQTSPAEGDSLTAAPPEVMLRFNEEVNGDLSEVTVKSGSTDVAEGSVEVEGESLYQPLRSDMPEGDYTVTYKVVSADGHPVSGTFDFTYAAPEGGEQDSDAATSTSDDTGTSSSSSSTSGGTSSPNSSSSSTTSPDSSSSSSSTQDAAPSGTSGPSDSAAPASSEDSSVPGWIWGVGALGVILVIVAVTLLARGRRSTSEEEDIDLDDHHG